MNIPKVGSQAIRNTIGKASWAETQVQVVRDASDMYKVVAVRAATFIQEQSCHYDEEFDGNDHCSMHLLAFSGNQPVATLRLRWFAGFGKVERVCVLRSHRGSDVTRVILAHAFEIAARKGYRIMIAQVQSRLLPMWVKMLNCTVRTERSEFEFSDYLYREIEIPLQAHPVSIGENEDPYVIIRPEGAWDEPGILERGSADGGSITWAA